MTLLRPRLSSPRCVLCHDPLSRARLALLECSACKTRAHSACAEEWQTGLVPTCPSPGCAGTLKRRPRARKLAEQLRLAAEYAFVLLVAVFLILPLTVVYVLGPFVLAFDVLTVLEAHPDLPGRGLLAALDIAAVVLWVVWIMSCSRKGCWRARAEGQHCPTHTAEISREASRAVAALLDHQDTRNQTPGRVNNKDTILASQTNVLFDAPPPGR